MSLIRQELKDLSIPSATEVLRRQWNKIAIASIFLLGFLIYGNSLFNDFVWDDEEQIVNNTLIRSFSNLPQFFTAGTFQSGGAGLSGIYYKPLLTTFFSFLYSLFGGGSFPFHLFQVLLHITNSVFLFIIFKHFFVVWLAFVLSLIFLIHPINVESVAYISGLQEPLFFFFGTLAFLTTLKTPFKGTRQLLLVGILILFSFLSKETGALFIPLILIYLVLFKKEKIFEFIWTGVSAAVVYGFLRFVIAGIYFPKHGFSPISDLTLFERLINIPKIIFHYLSTFFFPNDLFISQHWIVKQLNFVDFYLPLLIIVLFLTIILYFLKFSNNKPYLFWFLIGVLPHLQLAPLDLTVSDRWFYFPMVGMLGLIGTAVLKLKIKIKTYTIITLLIIIILSSRTILRNVDWKDGLTLYSRDILINKSSAELENNLGVELFRRRQYADAKKHFERSIERLPKYYFAYNNLGVVYEREKNYDKAQELYARTLEFTGYFLAYENLANLMFIRGDLIKGQKFTKEALKKLPGNPKLWLTLALIEYKLGNLEDAVSAAKTAYLLNPTDQTFYIYSRTEKNLPIDFK